MSRRLTVSVVCVALMCVAGAGVVVHAATGSADSGPGACQKHRRRALVGHGQSASGQKWYIVARLENNSGCHSRMLESSFHPFGHSGTVWGVGCGVPIGGSLSSTFVISSRQLKGAGEVAYGGVTSAKVATVEALTRHGEWIRFEPQRPQLSIVPNWLRNVRYFMEYLPAKVERIRVRDRTGRVLYQGGESIFGEFDDVGVL